MTVQLDQAIVDFVAYGIKRGYIHPLDKVFMQNQLLALLQKQTLEKLPPSEPLPQAKDSLSIFQRYALEEKLIEEGFTEQAVFSAQVMSLLTPHPSVLNERFWRKYEKSPKEATDDYYQLCLDNDYVQTAAIEKNISFHYPSKYGKLELTINLSKPEKDPKEIEAAKTMRASSYPVCQLCIENEGYLGNLHHPARSNHRIVRFPLGEETWGLQYSPYAYYSEHCIFLTEEHRPMEINRQTFQNLLEIVGKFPHYFVGSNADLPIVGGSILSHDHYQGGRHAFPMDEAPVRETFELPGFPTVNFGIVIWPLSVIRLTSMNQKELVAAAVHILEKWQTYFDEQAAIQSRTNDEPHNTVTPIARKEGEHYVLDLVLRNNRTTKEFPDGLFHPHQDVQHIKKENIGLIEVMGLAILPPRLKDELTEVEDYLLGERERVNPIHSEWAEQIPLPQQATRETVREAVQQAVGKVFERVLEDAGVFKLDERGQQAFRRFIDSL